MGMFDKYKAATQSAASSSPAPSPSGVLPPDAPKSDPAQAAKPVEGFQAVPPPRKMPIHDVPAPAPAPTPAPAADVDDEEAELERKLAAKKAEKAEKARLAAEAAERAKKEAEEKARQEELARAQNVQSAEPEVEKKRGPGRPPGAKNKRTLAEEAAASMGVVFESVTVTRGFTMNMGDFNSARFDVTMTARHGPGDAEAAYEQVLAEVNARVEAEFESLKKVTQLKVVK